MVDSGKEWKGKDDIRLIKIELIKDEDYYYMKQEERKELNDIITNATSAKDAIKYLLDAYRDDIITKRNDLYLPREEVTESIEIIDNAIKTIKLYL